jgi:hypothetical protein
MISKDYNNIFKSWKENVSSSDIYHMILYWINTYKDEITDPYVLELLEDVLYRMNNDDETNDIVEDFIYGSKYEVIRKYFN